MEPRARRKVVGAKVAPTEKKLIETAAAAEGLSVSTYLYRLVMPAARRRVAQEIAGQGTPVEALLQ